MNISIDDLTARLLGLLAEYVAEEPAYPSEAHDPHQIPEIARRHDEWDRHVHGLRALIGARLVDRCLEALGGG